MENKFSFKTQEEINNLKKRINQWKTLFSVEERYYLEGWAIYLRENTLYPRNIVIFKPYEQDCYELKSFEIIIDEHDNEKLEELYRINNIGDQDQLMMELKDVIYGKDILESTTEKFKNIL